MKERLKTAVITGATSGIGMAVTYLLLKDGMKAYLLGNHFDRLEALIQNHDGIDATKAIFCRVNLENEAEILETTRSIKKGIYIDYLIHCAAYYDNHSFENADVTSLDKSYRINVRAPYFIRLEVPDRALRAVTVVPGKTATPMQQKVAEQEGYMYHPEKMLQPEQIADMIHYIIHLPDGVEVTDIVVRPSVRYEDE